MLRRTEYRKVLKRPWRPNTSLIHKRELCPDENGASFIANFKQMIWVLKYCPRIHSVQCSRKTAVLCHPWPRKFLSPLPRSPLTLFRPPPSSHYSRDKHCRCLFKTIQFPRVPLLSRYLLKHFVAVGLGVSLCSLGSGTSFILCFWVKSFLKRTLLFAITNNQAHIYSQLKEHFLLVGIDILPQICLMFSFCWTMLKRMM